MKGYTLSGKARRFGANIDTDVIIPARYLNTSDPAELAVHCMEDADPGFAASITKGDIICAGANFGCGSSREHAPIAIKASGISCVIAVSFARIFYRNAINIGLPIFECADAEKISEGDSVTIDAENGVIHDLTTGEDYPTAPFPPFIRNIIESGGLLASLSPDGKKSQD